MNKNILHYLLYSILMLALVFGTSACSDDDEGNGLGGGYWLPIANTENGLHSDYNDLGIKWWEENGPIAYCAAYRFIDGSTVERYELEVHSTQSSQSIYDSSLDGHPLHYVAYLCTTYAYVIEDDQIYIADGNTGSITGGQLRLGSLTFQKVSGNEVYGIERNEGSTEIPGGGDSGSGDDEDIDDNWHVIECTFCKGSGICRKCNGDGKDAYGRECDSCHGTAICSHCEGTGEIWFQ